MSGTVGLDAGSNDIGNVGISGSLPAGTNDIGTVHVASQSPTIGEAECSVPDSDTQCAGDSGLTTGVLNTVSADCWVKQGQHLFAEFSVVASQFMIPLTFQMTLSGKINYDVYVGTVTNLNIPLSATPGENTLFMVQDYVASSGDGAICTLALTTTSS